MVRRLVKHEQIRFLHEQPGQVRSHDPPATQLPSQAFKIRFLKTKPAEYLSGLGDQLPTSGIFKCIVILCRWFSIWRLAKRPQSPGRN